MTEDAVLIVDDDVAMGSTVVEILALDGRQAVAVTTAAEALTRAKESRFGVVVCDQGLPDISGLDLCAVLRAIDPDVTLVLLTGHASLDSAIAAVGQIDQYLTKPVPPAELIRAVAAGAQRTAQRRAARLEAEQAGTRLAAIIEGTEDAVVAKSLTGLITTWNHGAERLYGYRADEAIGHPVSMLVPMDRPNEIPGILDRIRRGDHIEHFETVRMHKNGDLLNVSLTVSPIYDGNGDVVGASSIARDITDRLMAEELRRQLDDAAARHRQAMQINDTIVQQLVVAQSRLDLGDVAAGLAALNASLGHARSLIDDLLDATGPEGGETLDVRSVVPTPATSPSGGPYSVVVVDDSFDIRLLVRMILERSGEFTVAEEAGDGIEGVEAVRIHRPDLVLLDHAMPNLDGLGALPLMREASPHSIVVMLSGFSADRLGPTAMQHGAAAYITKSDLTSTLVPALQRVLGAVARTDR